MPFGLFTLNVQQVQTDGSSLDRKVKDRTDQNESLYMISKCPSIDNSNTKLKDALSQSITVPLHLHSNFVLLVVTRQCLQILVYSEENFFLVRNQF
jgi:hypothetical protein